MLSMLIVAAFLQPVEPDPVVEVRATLDAEQSAFFGGDCDTTVAHWSEELEMIVEGERRATSRDELRSLCAGVMQMVADGRIPSGSSGPRVIERHIEMLGSDMAYETVLRETPNGMRSSVTRLVVREPDGWRIKRMHEAIARSTPPGEERPRD